MSSAVDQEQPPPAQQQQPPPPPQQQQQHEPLPPLEQHHHHHQLDSRDPIAVLQVRKLLNCVRTSDYERINKLCEKGIYNLINLNEPTDGQTPLILAAIRNDEKMLAFLLDKGAHPNTVDFAGRSPLMKAAELGHVQALEILKSAHADSSMRDNEGKDVLFYCLSAPTTRHDTCMRIVLTMSTASVDNKSKETGTPIFVEACKNANELKDICLMLLDNGCDPSALEEKTNRSALHYAAKCGSLDVCRAILRKGANPNVADKDRITPAHEAASAGNFYILLLLSAYGAHFEVYDKSDNNPIHYGAIANAGSCCRFLATRGCNPKIKNKDGDTPKALAKERKNKDAVKNLSKGEKQYAKLTKQTMESGGVNWSIRLYDYMFEHKERIKEAFLVHDTEKTGKVSRDVFVQVVSVEGFQNLIETDEMKSLIVSHEKAKDEIDYELFLSGKKYITKLYLVASFEPKKKKSKKKKGKGGKGKKTRIIMPICLMNEGPRTDGGEPPVIYQPQHIHFTDTNRFNRDQAPEHPLQDDSAWYLTHPDKSFVNVCMAAHRGDLYTLLDALKRGMPVDVRDKYFKTPLMIAAANGDINTCKFLLTSGADVNAYDNFKWTSLHHACHAGQLDVVKMLVENGANINALTITQATPFMRAVESASFDVVEYLLEKGAQINHQNIRGYTALDIARDFADPRIYMAVKNKFVALSADGKKDKKGKSAKSASGKKKQKTGGATTSAGGKKKGGGGGGKDSPEAFKDDFVLPQVMGRRSSFSKSEAVVANETSTRILFKPLHVWTEQETTEKLLEQKQVARERFGIDVDFEDFKLPFIKNVIKKTEKLSIET